MCFIHRNTSEYGSWIVDNLEPKLNKWFDEMDGSDRSSKDSMRLVSLDDYNNVYHQLKDKYVPQLMNVRSLVIIKVQSN